jgi:hypothetical protein
MRKKLFFDQNNINLHLYFEERTVPRFFQILQKGFLMKVKVGCSISELFCGQFNISPEYFEDRIQTIFLEGNPVDDARTAIIKDGSHIAISGAMPGLVGAVLRKGGFYSSLRSGISYMEKGENRLAEDGTVFLKIFNLLLKDLGKVFLEKGIWVAGEEIHTFLKKQQDDFWKGFNSAKLNGKDLLQDELLNIKWTDRLVFLKVQDCNQ